MYREFIFECGRYAYTHRHPILFIRNIKREAAIEKMIYCEKLIIKNINIGERKILGIMRNFKVFN